MLFKLSSWREEFEKHEAKKWGEKFKKTDWESRRDSERKILEELEQNTENPDKAAILKCQKKIDELTKGIASSEFELAKIKIRQDVPIHFIDKFEKSIPEQQKLLEGMGLWKPGDDAMHGRETIREILELARKTS